MKKIVVILALVLPFSMLINAQVDNGNAHIDVGKKPKNIILMIGDGM